MKTTVPLEQLLAEVEDVIRTMPPMSQIFQDSPDILAWHGRASAIVSLWKPIEGATFGFDLQRMQSGMTDESDRGYRNVNVMLHRVRHDLRLKTVGPLTVQVAQGSVFDYFEEVRKVIEEARSDLLFVDPYLDAEFVSRYLPHVAPGTMIRLLAREYIPKLMPSVQLLRQQKSLNIEVRSAEGFHDRYVFVDRQACYHSGASFKDGPRKAPTTLTQIVDAFDEVFATYEKKWGAGTVHP